MEQEINLVYAQFTTPYNYRYMLANIVVGWLALNSNHLRNAVVNIFYYQNMTDFHTGVS